ncbi:MULTISPECIES: hypothetical protein [Burkholderia]|uniref:hypothetical protein n=1 Tax=Burkholderia TaxID=32008 RepID=UPI000F5F63CB|nr:MULTISPECIES: hypothetical protein [Burkholderia]
MAGINCENPKLTERIGSRWKKVVDQAKTVQNCLRDRQRDDRGRYPSPVSLALMVLVGHRKTNIKNIGDLNESTDDKKAVDVVANLSPRPTFIATYTFPNEFRQLVPRRQGKEAPKDGSVMYTPFVLFIARPSINSVSN